MDCIDFQSIEQCNNSVGAYILFRVHPLASAGYHMPDVMGEKPSPMYCGNMTEKRRREVFGSLLLFKEIKSEIEAAFDIGLVFLRFQSSSFLLMNALLIQKLSYSMVFCNM